MADATQRGHRLGGATSRLVCYAHRGARGHAPENTLIAFAMAFDLGADAIECDVQRSADGKLVILHDGTVNRTTDGRGLVSSLSFDALRALDAGRKWNIPSRIPTLDETFALVQAQDGDINLEIKAETETEALGTAEAVVPTLEALDPAFRERLLVSSFELPSVAFLKELLPWLRVAALYSGREWQKSDMVAPALAMNAEAIHPGVALVTPSLVEQAHEAGLRVNVWTANRWATIRKLLAWGVDGLFSDYPERIIIERARFEATAASGRTKD